MIESSKARGPWSALCLQGAAVVAASGVAVGVWGWRAAEHGPAFRFLWWNLLLAWVPWLLSLPVAVVGRRWLALGLVPVWLVFFPNAPYLVTDFIHLRPRPPAPLWLDVLVLGSFALAGCVLGWLSLTNVHRALERFLPQRGAWAVVLGVVGLSGFGVYLGRFLRWNSWDVVTEPGPLLKSAALALLQPTALAYSVAYAGFIGAGYLAVRAAQATRHPDAP